MHRNLQSYLSILKSQFTKPQKTQSFTLFTLKNLQQWRSITKVRLKWVKNKTLDHVIDKDTDVKAAMLLKDAIKRTSTSFITSKTILDWQKPLGLTFPVIRFLRRYPTLFHEFPHSRFQTLPCFRLTDIALALDEQEQLIYVNDELGILEKLSRVLMMLKSRSVPLQFLYRLRYDLGLPDKFEKLVVEKFPDSVRVEKGCNGLLCLSLVEWRDEFAVSCLERKCEVGGHGGDYREFRRGETGVAFPMSFPRSYGSQKKVKAWMSEFQKLHYISPYEDCTRLDPVSDLMEKRCVGLLHELLSLTIHKKTKRNYLRSLREELVLPHRFTRIFTRYPGIFYLSLKCKTTTVTLREGYRRGKLIDPHPLALLRNKVYHVMRTGLLYRSKGLNYLSPQDCMLDDAVDADGEEKSETEEEDSEVEEECWEGKDSDLSEESD
ncbi:protein WHAT'S THIS FACTOR 9, mitochondrial [Silene latifolia]|uniref:protein WHAT'S THIS FACTOR 9, mitochondrial n=1 Tax=Silene latifolia TaxID=37657 RepID=UPI003D773015